MNRDSAPSLVMTASDFIALLHATKKRRRSQSSVSCSPCPPLWFSRKDSVGHPCQSNNRELKSFCCVHRHNLDSWAFNVQSSGSHCLGVAPRR